MFKGNNYNMSIVLAHTSNEVTICDFTPADLNINGLNLCILVEDQDGRIVRYYDFVKGYSELEGGIFAIQLFDNTYTAPDRNAQFVID